MARGLLDILKPQGIEVVRVLVSGLVEDCHQAVVLGVGERIELVTVALGAARGQPHPNLHAGGHAVLDGRHAELLVVGAALRVVHGVAVEGGR